MHLVYFEVFIDGEKGLFKNKINVLKMFVQMYRSSLLNEIENILQALKYRWAYNFS